MPQAIDDFTIILPELTDVLRGELNIYHGLDQLWRMVEHYKMTAPLAIRVVDNKARCVRTIRGNHDPTTGWQLEEESSSLKPPFGDEVEFPLTMNTQDAKGNVLKMKLQFAGNEAAKGHLDRT
jgi:hypothetical protein